MLRYGFERYLLDVCHSEKKKKKKNGFHCVIGNYWAIIMNQTKTPKTPGNKIKTKHNNDTMYSKRRLCTGLTPQTLEHRVSHVDITR